MAENNGGPWGGGGSGSDKGNKNGGGGDGRKPDVPQIPEIDELGEYHLNIYAKNKFNEHLIPKDYSVAYDQFFLGGIRASLNEKLDKKSIKITQNKKRLDLIGEGFKLSFNKENGRLIEIN